MSMIALVPLLLWRAGLSRYACVRKWEGNHGGPAGSLWPTRAGSHKWSMVN